jgi:hypothetical protein
VKNTLDIINLIYTRLKTGALAAEITGSIYKGKRPLESLVEDVVINSLPINALQVQAAVANVNIHVPNITVTVVGIADKSQPNFQRLQELTELALIELSDVWADDYNFDVQQQVVIEDEDFKDHFSNIRLEFFSINITN